MKIRAVERKEAGRGAGRHAGTIMVRKSKENILENGLFFLTYVFYNENKTPVSDGNISRTERNRRGRVVENGVGPAGCGAGGNQRKSGKEAEEKYMKKRSVMKWMWILAAAGMLTACGPEQETTAETQSPAAAAEPAAQGETSAAESSQPGDPEIVLEEERAAGQQSETTEETQTELSQTAESAQDGSAEDAESVQNGSPQTAESAQSGSDNNESSGALAADEAFTEQDAYVIGHPMLSSTLFLNVGIQDIQNIESEMTKHEGEEMLDGHFTYWYGDAITYVTNSAMDEVLYGIILSEDQFELGCGLKVGMNEADIAGLSLPFEEVSKEDYPMDSLFVADMSSPLQVLDYDTVYLYQFGQIPESIQNRVPALKGSRISITALVKDGTVISVFTSLPMAG